MIDIEHMNGVYHLVGENGTLFKSQDVENIKIWIVERRCMLANSLKRQEEELRITTLRYREGIATLDDVLERNEDWFKSPQKLTE